MACFLFAKLAPLTCTFGCGFEGSCAFHAEDSPTTEWRKDPEFSEAIEKATAERLLLRLNRIEAGEQGWQGTAWALGRGGQSYNIHLYPPIRLDGCRESSAKESMQAKLRGNM
jgi:hypothetical protein